VLFMFIVGAELRAPHGARRQLVDAGWISAMSVLVPMIFGLAAAVLLYGRFAPEGVAFPTFALFMAAAMADVLAWIMMAPGSPPCSSCWSPPWRARCSAAPRAPASRATLGARVSRSVRS
jgi:hypothetical protein